MESASSSSSSKVASLRWAILRRAFLSASTDFPSEERIKCVSRRAERGFNLIFSHILEGHTFCSNNLVNLKELDEKRDAYVCYHLPGGRTPRLVLIQRLQKFLDLKNDFEVCKTNEVDNTGLVCIWPSEDVLTYFCLTHNGMFRNKRILELGSGYGLAGLAIAANSDAQEVVISDGNPQVVNCILMFAVVRVELHMIGAPLYFQPPDWTDRSTIRLSECRVNEALAKVNTGNAVAEDYKNTLKARLMRRSSWS